MTRRAVIIGFAGAAFLGGVTFFNDMVIKSTQLIGNYLPMSVFGFLVVFMLVANPLLGRVSARLPLSSRELAVSVAIVLFACCIPGRSLMHLFTNQLMMPHHHAQTEVAWRGSPDRVPGRMLADPSRDPEEALKGFVLGLGEADTGLSPTDVPWYAWTRTMAFWMPLMLTFFLAVGGMALVVHQQWLVHEKLPYPVVQFAHAFLPAEGSARSPIFHNRLFWLGCCTVLAIHGINYAYLWWPNTLIGVKLRIDISPLTALIPVYEAYPYILHPRLYFTALGFAYFVASDVSFAVGIAPYAFFLVAGIMGRYGFNIAARQAADGVGFYLYAGAFVGVFAVTMHTGRHYYRSVCRRAFGLRCTESVPPHAVWGLRCCAAGAVLFVLQLALIGLDWQLAAGFTVLALMYYTVISRLTVESGLFFVQAYLLPGGVLWGVLGESVGLDQLLIMGLVGMLLTFETRELMMPFAVNALALSEHAKVKVGRVAACGGGALVLAFAIAVPTTLYWQYREGAIAASYQYSSVHRPKMVFRMESLIRYRTEAQGRLQAVEALSGWGRFLAARPSRKAVIGFAVTFCLVIALGLLRLRFTKWPLHPAFLLILGSWPGISLGPSFLLGWAVKLAVTHYGGAKLYQRLRPLMIGIIAGEMLAGLLMMAHGAAYYGITGLRPKTMWLMPG